MKRFLLITLTFLLTLTLLVGCRNPQTELTAEMESVESSTATTSNFTGEMSLTETEDDTTSYYTDVVYAQQIKRYHTAISQQWDMDAYWDQEMSSMVVHYYGGTPLDNVGFTLMDLDGDGIQELMIGAILGSERDPLVFEIWTLQNNEPVMLAQSGSHNRYYLQYAEEDNLWSVAYEAENGAANRAVYYLQLLNGEFNVTQGVIFDATANEKAPWFMTYDLDWDVSNDTPIPEDSAKAVMGAGRNTYAATEYFPYCLY